MPQGSARRAKTNKQTDKQTNKQPAQAWTDTAEAMRTADQTCAAEILRYMCTRLDEAASGLSRAPCASSHPTIGGGSSVRLYDFQPSAHASPGRNLRPMG
jgi:hypothetical protein